MKKVPMSIPRVAPTKKPKVETVTLRHLGLALAESSRSEEGAGQRHSDEHGR